MRGIIAAIVSIGLAQFLKVPINGIITGKWDWRQLVGSGGMPSSHAAGVTSLATYVGLKLGSRSLDFALSVIFGLIVMYDAQGVRRHAGDTAIKVNELEKRIDQLSGQDNDSSHDNKTKELKESIGHQPEEVLGGALLGFFVGLVCFFNGNKK
ncbi:divergent PAP2 family protein [Anaerobacillus alkaliphilus]|uniref:Divergent PAP2 family protein n=1 Tax=Anaerobacillus alkaliphilus TaxID=1548597 RepID=A0A4Q0VPM6_9BACI|nr:divergent PAP2 family protein [Anaerobacillus alkaliphilus]RXI97837.1 divergent PAP2 family protein [Anaerobacillus alkaliphilus]